MRTETDAAVLSAEDEAFVTDFAAHYAPDPMTASARARFLGDLETRLAAVSGVASGIPTVFAMYPALVGGAAVVTFSLALLMHSLIASALRAPPDLAPGERIEIARVDRESETIAPPRVAHPSRPLEPPPTPVMRFDGAAKPGAEAITVGPFSHLELDLGPQTSGHVDASGIPLVRVPPQYPHRAAERAIEGWVLLEFTITKSGSVSDPVVIDADPPGIFDRSALRAVRKWRYQPRIQNGEPVERHGVQTVISFELEDGRS